MTLLKNSSSRRRIAPLVAGLAAFLLAAGGGSAWAYWTAQASATGTATTNVVAVSHAGFDAPAVTKYLPSALTSTRSFTVRNGGSVAGTATVSISAPEQGAQAFPLSVWPVTDASACTDRTAVPSTGVTSGTWASTALTVSLNANAAAVYCVRTSIPDWKTMTEASGGRTITPQLTVGIKAQGWVASAPTATHKQQTAGMYPFMPASRFDTLINTPWNTIHNRAVPTICLDVAGSGGSGTKVISWSCHQSPNQRWKFIRVEGASQPLVTIMPKHAQATRLTSDNGLLKIAGSAGEQWYVQQSTDVVPFYQLVSASSGRCLGLSGSASDNALSTVECDDARAQLSFFSEG